MTLFPTTFKYPKALAFIYSKNLRNNYKFTIILFPFSPPLFRWTGSNTNPNNNDGQGKAGTDRSNIVLLRNQMYSEGTPGMAVPTGEKKGHFGNSYPQHLRHSETFLGLSEGQRDDLAMLGTGLYYKNIIFIMHAMQCT